MTRSATLVLAWALCSAAFAASADITLRNRAELEAALRQGEPCCVVDARTESSRASLPLVGAVPYREGMKLDEGGPAVVIADTEARALEVGKTLAATAEARQIFVVRGGAKTWQAVARRSPITGPSPQFVIPANTCEQGKPLQTLRSRRP